LLIGLACTKSRFSDKKKKIFLKNGVFLSLGMASRGEIGGGSSIQIESTVVILNIGGGFDLLARFFEEIRAFKVGVSKFGHHCPNLDPTVRT
jgi:hypothetical protein